MGRTQTTDEEDSKELVIPVSFKPSRGGNLERMVQQGAAGGQPSGLALPSLLSGEPSTPEEHRDAALTLGPFTVLLERAISTEERKHIEERPTIPDLVIARRMTARVALAESARKLEGQRKQWADNLPEKAPAKNLHFPLMYWGRTPWDTTTKN